MVDKRILETLDACRPGSQDLQSAEFADVAASVQADPELQALHHKIQSIDARVSEAMHETPVPEGLAARLLASVAATHGPTDALAGTAMDEAAACMPEAEPPVEVRRLFSRRRVLGAFAAVAALLLVGLTVALLLPSSQTPITAQNWQSVADEWYKDVLAKGDWQAMPARKGYPISKRVLPRPQHWTAWRCSMDRSAVAYDLTPPGTKRVTLIVVQASVPRLGSAPPASAFYTQGRSIATWQEGGLLYVLVVEGPESRYRGYVDSKVGPIA